VFAWFRKYVRKIGIFGVEVEFHPPTEAAAPAVTPKYSEPPATTAATVAQAAPRLVSTPDVNRPSGSLVADKAAFLTQVEEYESAAARADYERVLDDLIAWSEAQGGQIIFSPRPAKNSQATVTFRFRGLVFWDAWPQKRLPTKFTYEYNHDRAYLLAEFAKLSANGQPASEKLPTVAFRDLVPEAARRRLKQLLGEVLGRLVSPPAAQM